MKIIDKAKQKITNKKESVLSNFSVLRKGLKIGKNKMIMFIIAFFSFTNIASAAINTGIVDISNSKLANVFFVIFPFANKEGYEVSSSLSDYSSDYFGLLFASTLQIAMPLSAFMLSVFTFIYLIKLKSGEVDKDTISKMIAISLVIGTLSNASLITYETSEGNKVKISATQFFSLNLMGETLVFLENKAENIKKETFLMPEVELFTPLSVKNNYFDFTKAYLSNDFSNEEVSFNLFKEDSVYVVDVDLGGENIIIRFNSQMSLNERVKKELEVDLGKKEVELIEYYVNTMIETAVIAKEFTKKIKIGKSGQATNRYDYAMKSKPKLAYDLEYNQYCKDIETPVMAELDKASYHSYLQVLSACKSDNFMNKAYSNNFYEYKKEVSDDYTMRKNYTTLFGFENVDTRLDLEDLKEKTKEICSGSYIPCQQASLYALSKIEKEQIKMGLLTPITDFMYSFFEVFEDNETTFFISRSFKAGETKTDSFKDNSLLLERESLVVFKMKGLPGNYRSKINDTLFTNIDIKKINIPKDLDSTLNIISGSDISQSLNRFAYCLENPEVVGNGFRCLSITSELNNFSKFMVKSGIQLKIYNAAKNKTNAMSKTKPKNNFGGSLPQQALGKVGEAKYFLMAFGANSLIESSDSKNPYRLGLTAEAMAVSMMVMQTLGYDFSEQIDKFANKMITKGFLIYFLAFSIPILLIWSIFKVFAEVIYEILISPLTLLIFAWTKGIDGVWSVYKELLADLMRLVLLVVLSIVLLKRMDIMLSLFTEELVYSVGNSMSSVSSFIAESIMLSFVLLIFAWAAFSAPKKMIADLTQILNKFLKN